MHPKTRLALTLVLLGSFACGSSTPPPPAITNPSLDVCPAAGTPPAGVTYQDCPAPAAGAAPRNVIVMDPETGQVKTSIDLSCFATNSDKLPRPYFMARANGKIYVALQDFDASFSNFQNGKVVVLDPTTDRVLRKIDLQSKKNISDLQVGPDGMVYVAAQGILGLDSPGFSVDQELSGGIDIIDPATDKVVGSLDDDTFGGNVTRLALASATSAYAVVAVFDKTSMPKQNRYSVKAWNPQARTVSATSLYTATGSFINNLLFDSAAGVVFIADNDLRNPRLVALRDRDQQIDMSRQVALNLGPAAFDLYSIPTARSIVAVETDFMSPGLVQTVDILNPPPYRAVTAGDPTGSGPVLRVTRSPAGAPYVFVINGFGDDNVQWLDPGAGFATRTVGTTKAQWTVGARSNPQDVLAMCKNKIYVTLQN
jgi:hypothetical protein